MSPCSLCGKETDREIALVKARYKETQSRVREEKVPLLGRNYRADESPELRKVGEVRYYIEKEREIGAALCDDCLDKRRKEDSWFQWPQFVPLVLGGIGMILGGNIPLVQILSLFFVFMALVGIVMRVARAVSHTDEIRITELLESHFLGSGEEGDTISRGEFLYRPVKNPKNLILLTLDEWDSLESDEKGPYVL